MDIDVRLREPAGEPQGALVLIHGRGADEHDLFPLLDMLDPDRRLLGICPGGPLALPPGGRHWYAVHRVGYPDPDTFHSTFRGLSGWLDRTLGDAGITIDRTVIGGFSQGAVMSYSLSLGPGRPKPAGVLALSGFIPQVPDFDISLEDAAGLPVAIGHGLYDPVITVDFGRTAKQDLEAAGAEVIYRESPMPHTIDPEFLVELRPWLEERLPA